MKWKPFFGLAVLSALSTMVVALYNGYPLMDSDTGAYISIGFENILAPDRMPFYGWFIRFTSFRASLWFTLFIQCLILSYVLLKYIHFIQKKIPAVNTTLLTVVAIAAFTCVSWVASFIMPDVFAAILLLAVLLYLSEDNARISAVINLVIIFLALLIHNSHVVILFIFSVAMLVWTLLKRNKKIFKRVMVLIYLCVFSWGLVCTINARNGNGFTFSKGGQVFFMARLAEMGILKNYLDENCGKTNFHLCAYRDSIPEYTWDFIWNNESPLYKTGGWNNSKAGYDSIILGILTTPRYLKMFVLKSATGTLRELSEVAVPAMVRAEGKDGAPGKMIQKYYSDEQHEFIATRQHENLLEGTVYNYMYCLIFALSSLWILFFSKNISGEILFIYGIIILFFVVNAFVMSTFSTVLNRYQNRVFWILPATNIIVIIKYYTERGVKRMSEDTAEK